MTFFKPFLGLGKKGKLGMKVVRILSVRPTDRKGQTLKW
jgi:hypothetical protein